MESCQGLKGGLRRSPAERRAAAAARTSGKRSEGWSKRRLCIGMILKGSDNSCAGGG